VDNRFLLLDFGSLEALNPLRGNLYVHFDEDILVLLTDETAFHEPVPKYITCILVDKLLILLSQSAPRAISFLYTPRLFLSMILFRLLCTQILRIQNGFSIADPLKQSVHIVCSGFCAKANSPPLQCLPNKDLFAFDIDKFLSTKSFVVFPQLVEGELQNIFRALWIRQGILGEFHDYLATSFATSFATSVATSIATSLTKLEVLGFPWRRRVARRRGRRRRRRRRRQRGILRGILWEEEVVVTEKSNNVSTDLVHNSIFFLAEHAVPSVLNTWKAAPS